MSQNGFLKRQSFPLFFPYLLFIFPILLEHLMQIPQTSHFYFKNEYPVIKEIVFYIFTERVFSYPGQ